VIDKIEDWIWHIESGEAKFKELATAKNKLLKT